MGCNFPRTRIDSYIWHCTKSLQYTSGNPGNPRAVCLTLDSIPQHYVPSEWVCVTYHRSVTDSTDTNQGDMDDGERAILSGSQAANS